MIMRLSHIKTMTTTASKTVNSHLMVVESPRYFNSFKEGVYQKIIGINNWYTRVIGLDEVKFHQDRVTLLQQKLFNVQEKRREIGTLLGEIRRRSNDLQEQIQKVKRQDDLERFLDLMKEETGILKQENQVSEMFTNCDREEREVFTAFTNAIRDSHEKQRAQLEYTKYLGLLLSITGSFLVFVYSTLKKNDLKDFIEAHIQEMSMNAADALSTSLVNIRESQKKNETNIDSIMESNSKLLQAMNTWKRVSAVSYVKGKDDLRQMPYAEKVAWFGVISLVAFVILKTIYN